jgi:hypothetical protein
VRVQGRERGEGHCFVQSRRKKRQRKRTSDFVSTVVNRSIYTALVPLNHLSELLDRPLKGLDEPLSVEDVREMTRFFERLHDRLRPSFGALLLSLGEPLSERHGTLPATVEGAGAVDEARGDGRVGESDFGEALVVVVVTAEVPGEAVSRSEEVM